MKETVFIIGGGASLLGFDFSCLEGRGYLLGVNRSAFQTKCDGVFSLDQQWIGFNKKECEQFKGDVFLAIPHDVERAQYLRLYVEKAKYFRREREKGLHEDPTCINGLNSGFGALNLAYHWRPKEIYLLGFDMQANSTGRVHWHDSYPWFNAITHRLYGAWCKDFDRAAEQCLAAGISVFNCNPNSKLECFTKITLESLNLAPVSQS